MDTETNRSFRCPVTLLAGCKTANDGESPPVEYVLGSGVLLNKKNGCRNEEERHSDRSDPCSYPCPSVQAVASSNVLRKK